MLRKFIGISSYHHRDQIDAAYFCECCNAWQNWTKRADHFQNGSYFHLSGGKIDQKAFSGYWVIPDICNMPAWASIVKQTAGKLLITINVVHDSNGICTSVWFHASGETITSMSGIYDNQQNQSIEGNFTLAEVNCSSIPEASTVAALSPWRCWIPGRGKRIVTSLMPLHNSSLQ